VLSPFVNPGYNFYRSIVPILKTRCSKLPLVETYLVQPNTIIMEDLLESGFETLTQNFEDFCRDDLVRLDHVRLVIRSLAQLHAASFGTNWLELIPEIKEDALFEGDIADVNIYWLYLFVSITKHNVQPSLMTLADVLLLMYFRYFVT
jgi:hypothetical protein